MTYSHGKLNCLVKFYNSLGKSVSLAFVFYHRLLAFRSSEFQQTSQSLLFHSFKNKESKSIHKGKWIFKLNILSIQKIFKY